MRRRRLLTRTDAGVLAVAPRDREGSAELSYLEHVVCVRFPVAAARTYLRRALGNEVRLHLVEAGRGEPVGSVREVRVRHANSGARTTITARRLLSSGEPASFFVPDHLVTIEPHVQGQAANHPVLSRDDVVVLVVPVRGYTRFLPAIFQGDGPVARRERHVHRSNALQRVGGAPAEETSLELSNDDGDFLPRFLFLFQHVMAGLADRIDRLDELTDPMVCEAQFLPWLASWVDFDLDASLPVHQQRELVRRAIRLYRSRGTRIGIEEMVTVLTTAPVRVRERARPKPMVLGRSHLADGASVVARFETGEPDPCYLLDPARHADTDFFVLLLEAREAFLDRFGARAPSVLRRIVEVVSRERPWHVAFTLRFDQSA